MEYNLFKVIKMITAVYLHSLLYLISIYNKESILCYRVWRPSNVIAFNPIKVRVTKGKQGTLYVQLRRQTGMQLGWMWNHSRLAWKGGKGLY